MVCPARASVFAKRFCLECTTAVAHSKQNRFAQYFKVVKMRVGHGMFSAKLVGYTFVVMVSVILSGGVKMRVEHGML